MPPWRSDHLSHLPELNGRIAIVTGGNIGLGFASALELSRHGAHVVIACRSPERGQDAVARLHRLVPGAVVDVMPLDLTDQGSIADFAARFAARFDRLDILMNNAGVVHLDRLCHTADGHEMHFATNHLGHFALTGRLLPLLTGAAGARVVTLSSLAHKSGNPDFDDLDWRRRPYSRTRAYADSKLANLMFMHSLQGRFTRAGLSAISVAAHPGLTATERQQTIGIGGVVSRFVASPVARGVQSQLLAAVGADISGGDFIGPRFGIAGPPCRQNRQLRHLDTALCDRLWQVSEDMSNVRYALPIAAA